MESAIPAASSLDLETVIALLDSVDWFSSLTHGELEGLARQARIVQWERGEVVFEEGDRGNRCYVLHTGDVKVLRRFPDGRRITLARLGPRNIFGELAMCRGAPATGGG